MTTKIKVLDFHDKENATLQLEDEGTFLLHSTMGILKKIGQLINEGRIDFSKEEFDQTISALTEQKMELFTKDQAVREFMYVSDDFNKVLMKHWFEEELSSIASSLVNVMSMLPKK